jgi:hypothetical protein
MIDVEDVTDQLLQHILDHLNEFVEGAPDRAKLAICGDVIVGHDATYSATSRDALRSMLARIPDPAAAACAKAIAAKAADEIPILFVVRVPGQGTALQTAVAIYTPHGSQRGGDT